MTHALWEPLAKILVLAVGLMTAAAYLVLLERRLAAWIQDRLGPNRVGIPLTRIRMKGLGQPLADGGKFFFKEEFTPGHVDRALYTLAPVVMFVAAISVFAVIPFGGALPPLKWLGLDRPIPLVAAPGVDVGVLYVFAVSSMAVYGVILGGWASNNKYSFLGALRSSAQLIAYELPLGLGVLGVVLAAGSLNLQTIIEQQGRTGIWFAFSQPLGFVVFLTAAFSEAGRLPFDLPECEQELVGGYHTEYSAVRLLLLLVGEYLHMITAAFLIVILFLGGWHFWWLTGSGPEATWLVALLRVAVLLVKVFVVILFFMLVRWTWPRFRFDQLMGLAWKVMLPLGLANFVLVAALDQARLAVDPGGQRIFWSWMLIIPAWVALLAAWLIVAIAGSASADNRPRRPPRPGDEIEPQL